MTRLHLAVGAVALTFCLVAPTQAQDAARDYEQAHRTLAADLGMADAYDTLRALADDTPTPPGDPRYRETFLAPRLMFLLLQGYGTEEVAALREAGTDPLTAALLPREARAIADDVALSDLVATGTVRACRLDRTLEDGLNASVELELDRVFKGEARPGGTVVLRQAGGVRDEQGLMYLAKGTVLCEEGARGLFFLSNAVYRYAAAVASAPERAPTALRPTSPGHYLNRGRALWISDDDFEEAVAETLRAATAQAAALGR